MYRLYPADKLYDFVIRTVGNVSFFSTVMLYIVTSAGALILALSVKGRRYEMGVLLSLGESRAKMTGQLLCEVLIVAVIAFSLTLISGGWTGQWLADAVMEQQAGTVAEEAKEVFASEPDTQQPVEEMDRLHVSVSGSVVLSLIGTGLLIVVAAIVFPSVMVLRLKPKEIMTKRE